MKIIPTLAAAVSVAALTVPAAARAATHHHHHHLPTLTTRPTRPGATSHPTAGPIHRRPMIELGLTGGAPLDLAGQTLVHAAGIGWMSWTGKQTWVDSLVPGLQLRVQMRRGMTPPDGLHPGLYATADEPWLTGVDPAFVQQQVDAIHAIGGRTITNQGWGMDPSHWPTVAQIAAYPGDIVSVDTYPDPTHPLAEMSEKVTLMHEAAQRRPVWAALQVCSTSNIVTGRVPTAATEWAMAKQALDAGATGLMFYGSGNPYCFQTPEDTTGGFNWSAYRSTVLPTIRRIQAYRA